MLKLFKLIAKTNFKSPVIVFPFLMPTIFMLLYSAFTPAGVDAAQTYVNGIFFTLLAITIMQSGLMGFGFNFMNLKKSVLLRRVGATKMTKAEVLGAFVLYGLALLVINISWSFILFVVLTYAGFFYPAGTSMSEGIHIDWGYMTWDMFGKVVLASLIGTYLSYGVGLFLVSISKNINMFQGLTSMYFFATSILGGMMMPTGSTPQWMVDIGYALPHVYFSHLFDWAKGATTLDALNLSLDIAIPLTVGTIATVASIKFLKFD